MTVQSSNTIGFEFIQTLSAELSKGLVELPAFPEAILQIKNILEDPDVTPEQVAAVVGSEPVFSARIINIANSAAFGSRTPISDIPAAITRIGFKMAHNVAVSTAVNQIMSTDSTACKGLYLDLWRHSISVAAYAYIVARKITKINADKALLAGLLHDIGKVYILSRAIDSHPELIDNLEVLSSVLSEWHTGIGSAILDNWDMDKELSLAADEHELYERDILGQADLTDVVLVANLLANTDLQQTDTDTTVEEGWIQLGSFKRLKIDRDALTKFKEDYQDEINSIISALGN